MLIIFSEVHILHEKDPAESILANRRSFELDSELLSIKEILELIPGTK